MGNITALRNSSSAQIKEDLDAVAEKITVLVENATKKRRLLHYDPLYDVLSFYSVSDLLRLSETSWLFFNAFLKHRGRRFALGVHEVTVGNTECITVQHSVDSEIKDIFPEHSLPPSEILINRLHISLASSASNIETIREFMSYAAPSLREHTLSLKAYHSSNVELLMPVYPIPNETFPCFPKIFATFVNENSAIRFFCQLFVLGSPVIDVSVITKKHMQIPVSDELLSAIFIWLHFNDNGVDDLDGNVEKNQAFRYLHLDLWSFHELHLFLPLVERIKEKFLADDETVHRNFILVLQEPPSSILISEAETYTRCEKGERLIIKRSESYTYIRRHPIVEGCEQPQLEEPPPYIDTPNNRYFCFTFEKEDV